MEDGGSPFFSGAATGMAGGDIDGERLAAPLKNKKVMAGLGLSTGRP